MCFGFGGRQISAGFSDHHCQLQFPISEGSGRRDADRLACGRDRCAGLDEEARDHLFFAHIGAASLFNMAGVVTGQTHNLSRAGQRGMQGNLIQG